MLVQEMHVQFDTKLQRMNSNAFDIFYPMEKDILLNYVQEKLIRTALSNNEGNRKREGYQATTKRYGDLETLITKRMLQMHYLETAVLFSVLPFDYHDYIVSNGLLFSDCKELVLSPKVNSGVYVSYLPFVKSAGDIYPLFKWTLNYTDATPPLVLADISLYPNFPLLAADDEMFLIANFGIYETNRQNHPVKVYWEKYGELYAPNNFIFVSTQDNLANVTMNIQGAQTEVSTFEVLPYEHYPSNLTVRKSNARLIESHQIENYLGNPYQTTAPDSPIVELSDDRLLLHHNKYFAANQIELVYIRKPKPISSILNVSCELHFSRHDKLVDMAVEVASAYIGNPRSVKDISMYLNHSNE